MAKPVSMLCLYRPKKGKADAFLDLLRAHWPALRAAGLASPRRAELFRATDRRGRPLWVERFEWRDGAAAQRAHAAPEVLAVWGPMERLAEEMDFLELEPLRERGRAVVPRASRPPSGPAGRRAASRPPARGVATRSARRSLPSPSASAKRPQGKPKRIEVKKLAPDKGEKAQA